MNSRRTARERPLFPLLLLVVFAVSAVYMAIPELAFMLGLFGVGLLLPLLLNVALLGTAWDAWRGRLPRVLLLIPIVVYGGYFVVAAITWASFMDQARAIAAQNATFDIPFDPQREALFEAPSESAIEGLVRPLVEGYVVPSAYVSTYRLGDAVGRAVLATKDLCQVDLPGRVDHPGPVTDVCLLYILGLPDRPTIDLSTNIRIQRQGLRRTRLAAVTASKKGHPKRTLTTGASELPGPIPFPIYGCWDSGDCTLSWLGPTLSIAGFGKSQRDDPYIPLSDLLAKAWRLPPRASGGFEDPSGADVRRRVTEEISAGKLRVERALVEPGYDPKVYVYQLTKFDPEWAHQVGCEKLRRYAAQKQQVVPECR